MISSIDFKRVSPVPLNDFLVMDLPKREYIVKPFLPQKGLIEVYAAPGIGKTTFAITFAIAAALGKSFLHWEVTRPWRVLYIDGEMEAADMRERIAATANTSTLIQMTFQPFRFYLLT